MISTFNGCYHSEFSITPKNWKTGKASLKKPWRIFYRFHDPNFKAANPRGKDISIRGMNVFKTLQERQEVTQDLLQNETDKIDRDGFNHFTGEYMAPQPEPEPQPDPAPEDTPPEADEIITAETSIIIALHGALKKVDIVGDTKTDMRSVLKYFEKSAIALKKDHLPINKITRGDIIDILDNCKNLKVETVVRGITKIRNKIWNANQFNHYRKYLLILYGYLDVKQVVLVNLIEKIPLQVDLCDEEKAPRAILSDSDGKKVNLILQEKDPNFLRFVHIFFHSGARIKELMRIKGKHVNLETNRFRVLIKKRKKKTWVPKTIKDIAMPFWREVMRGCGPEDYVFSLDFLPGLQHIVSNTPSRRWKNLIKSTGILADLYSLKHKNSTVMMDMILEELRRREEAQRLVAEHNSHLSPKMMETVYDVKFGERKHLEIKGLQNTL